MTNRYHVNYEDVELAMAHVLPHPRYKGHVAISIIPFQRAGGLKTALYGNFPDTKPAIEAVTEVLASAGIEPGKVRITPAGC